MESVGFFASLIGSNIIFGTYRFIIHSVPDISARLGPGKNEDKSEMTIFLK